MPKITLKYVWSEKVKALPYYWIGQKVHLGFLSILAVALHSSTLAGEIPWMEEPGVLQSMGL